MLKFSFFDSVIGADGQPDRAFGADDFSKYFGTLIKNGVFPNPSTNFQIVADQENMTVKAEAGLAWINGHLTYDDSIYILNIDKADSSLDRIDRIVLRLDTLERCIKWVVKKGNYAADPIAPSLQRDADGYEIGIADVRVGKGVSAISQSAVKDLRLDTAVCGIVTGQVTQIDTSTIYAQLEGFKDDYAEKIRKWEQEQKSSFETWSTERKNAFEIWYETVRAILDGDVAGNLTNRIVAIENRLNTMQLTADNVSINAIEGLNGPDGQPATDTQKALEIIWAEINGQAAKLNGINNELEAEIGTPTEIV